MSNTIFDKTSEGLAASLRMRQLRHDITAANIANAETPGYHARKLDFEEALARALDIDELRKLNTDTPGKVDARPMHVKPDIYENPDGVVSNDGNTVDLEKEMTTLTENSLQYKAALQLINKKLAAIKYSIGEGR